MRKKQWFRTIEQWKIIIKQRGLIFKNSNFDFWIKSYIGVIRRKNTQEFGLLFQKLQAKQEIALEQQDQRLVFYDGGQKFLPPVKKLMLIPFPTNIIKKNAIIPVE